jgi:hypothetical protein
MFATERPTAWRNCNVIASRAVCHSWLRPCAGEIDLILFVHTVAPVVSQPLWEQGIPPGGKGGRSIGLNRNSGSLNLLQPQRPFQSYKWIDFSSAHVQKENFRSAEVFSVTKQRSVMDGSDWFSICTILWSNCYSFPFLKHRAKAMATQAASYHSIHLLIP